MISRCKEVVSVSHPSLIESGLCSLADCFFFPQREKKIFNKYGNKIVQSKNYVHDSIICTLGRISLKNFFKLWISKNHFSQAV